MPSFIIVLQNLNCTIIVYSYRKGTMFYQKINNLFPKLRKYLGTLYSFSLSNATPFPMRVSPTFLPQKPLCKTTKFRIKLCELFRDSMSGNFMLYYTYSKAVPLRHMRRCQGTIKLLVQWRSPAGNSME